ncbi:MAG: peptidase M56 BlaR1 [Firmicutes bacterium]|nr:peptidase M56 BlaR1 [Bacillota bacterium]
MRLKPRGVRTVVFGVALVAGVLLGTLGFRDTAGVYLNQGLAPVPVYPRNENGQTYGSAAYATSPDTEPDLIAAPGVDGTLGYVRKVDLDGPPPKTPDESLAPQRRAGGSIRVRYIPLYAVDGETVIGVFKITTGQGMELSAGAD